MRSLKYLLLAVLLGLTFVAHGNEAAPASDDPVLEKRVNKLSEELRCLVCQNQTIADSHAELAVDLKNLIREKLKLKYHWAVADYLQRAARHIASKTDVAQAYAVGKAAVELALKGHNAVMPAIVRKSDKPYRWSIGVADLNEVANVEKKMPRDYISQDGFHITEKCRRYLLPLIQGEDYPPYRNGLPVYVRLKNVTVPKKLEAGFKI